MDNLLNEKRITFTLSEILNNCNDWENFCNEFGWSEYAVNEGGGDLEQSMSLIEAKRYGLLPS